MTPNGSNPVVGDSILTEIFLTVQEFKLITFAYPLLMFFFTPAHQLLLFMYFPFALLSLYLTHSWVCIFPHRPCFLNR